jgi:putative ABC transport system ATP-binding protein
MSKKEKNIQNNTDSNYSEIIPFAGAVEGYSLIEIKNLSKDYIMGEVGVPALIDINLKIQKNEYVAIMGPSGSGKSTFMNILGCLDTPTTGEYVFNGSDVSSLSDDALSAMRNKEIGFIFQNFNLLPRLNALQNVELPLIYSGIKSEERKARALKALERVGLADRIHHKSSEMSGGQRQRVAIARALVTNPGILLADEPTGALDSKTGDEIMLLFNELHNEGNTIILITHEQEIANHAHRTIYIKDGMIHSDNTNSKIK